MKALVLQRYGGPDPLVFRDVPRPVPKAGEVLVQVQAVGLNPIDNMIPKGTFKAVLKFKLPATMGSDLAGVVVEVGADVTRFRPGDEVFASLFDLGPGSLAESTSQPAGPRARSSFRCANQNEGDQNMSKPKEQADNGAKRVALVTGASSGIGEAAAERLAQAGYKVYGTSRRGNQTGERAFEMLSLDVTSDESIEAAVLQVIRANGRLDLLVNNAGFGVAPAAAEESSMEQTRAIFETNFFGLVRMTRAVLPQMRKQGSGRIINIGSVLGFLPGPYMALYSATKHAVEGYSESLDHELRTSGIRVTVIEPAYTRTQFEANTLEADRHLDEHREVRAAMRKVMTEAVAAGDAPGVVAEVVMKAALADSPRLRYTAGPLAARLALFRRFAPAGIVDGGVRKSLRLDALPPSNSPSRAYAK